MEWFTAGCQIQSYEINITKREDDSGSIITTLPKIKFIQLKIIRFQRSRNPDVYFMFYFKSL